MIPLVLRLRNFMSYGEIGATLDFAAFQVACLSGENGHGKSALLDAVTWALWGRSRARSEDDLVQLGKLDMEVELEFALGTERYRVVRKRTLRASGRRRIATPTLELQIAGDDGYRSLSGDSVQATQAIVARLLKIDYETFINSAFIVQGRADEFTVKSPAERKRVLADLLGLERYAQLEESAREAGRRCAIERQQIEFGIVEIDQELAKRPRYQEDLVAATERIRLADEERRLADAELGRLRAEVRTVDQLREQAADLRRRLGQDQRELASLERHRRGEVDDVARLEALIARGPKVRQAVEQLGRLRAQETALGQGVAEVVRLTDERAQLERAIARARERLVADRQVAEGEVARLRRLATAGPAAASQLDTIAGEIAALSAAEAERETLRQRSSQAEAEAKTLAERNRRLRGEMTELKAQRDTIDSAGATCPVCRTELTPDGRAALLAQLQAEGEARADEFRRNLIEIKRLESQRDADRAAGEVLERRLAERAGLESRAAGLRRQVEEAEGAAAGLPAATRTAEELARTIETRDFARGEHALLEQVVGQITAIGYDRATHDRVRAEIQRYQPAEQLLTEVIAAEGGIAMARERVEQTTELLTARQRQLDETAERLRQVEDDIARADDLATQVADASARVDRGIEQSRDAHQALGVAQQRLDHCDYLAHQRAERSAAAAKAAAEKTIYDDLALAFGRKGIQAMIIEGAIPEIESEANELLQRLTDGELNVSFETQREAKSGDGVIETLDIKLSDAYGTRNYEMYSGGEAFRVNFAIRIALSKLLARRAGAQLQFLIIDEGFGTQDQTGRERLVEALNTVSADFEKVLVVTHIQELKDAFPVRIDVVKGPEGSIIAATSVLDG